MQGEFKKEISHIISEGIPGSISERIPILFSGGLLGGNLSKFNEVIPRGILNGTPKAIPGEESWSNS